MLRNLSSSTAQPSDLRRRHQPRRDYSFRWDNEAHDEKSNCGLDLSIHRPDSPFTTPQPAVTRDQESHVSNSRRRTRNSRGTKEAKKRRDARRNRRKLAAQFLDEQLSRDIDETLTKASIRPPPPVTLPPPSPFLPTTSFSFWPAQPQQSTALARRSPWPLQLPPLDFSTFDVHDFPILAPPKQSPPLSPRPLFTGVPSWCPMIPSLSNSGDWSCGWPKFFDLSHLPEKKSSPAREVDCRDLRLWKPDTQHTQRKQSRFFPQQHSPKPTVRLPTTACTLHRSEQYVESLISVVSHEGSSARPRFISDAVEKIVAAAVAEINSEQSDEPTAATLWHILSGEIEKRRTTLASGRESTWEDESLDAGGVPLPVFDEQALAVELDSTEIPYTHANSLTGYANEVAELHSGSRHPDLLLSDSAIYLAEAISHIDDDTADEELAAMPWPLNPVPLGPETPQASELAAEYVDQPDTNTDGDNIADSVAQYDSEQQLFQVEQSTIQAPIETSCDLETFLSMGHVENCWCRDCEEEPELVDDDWATPLTESDDWMMWSASEDGEYVEDAAEPVTVVNGWEDDPNNSSQPWQTWNSAFDWDDMYHFVAPQSPVTEELEDDFLGYDDDGYALSQESDNDWMWSGS